MTATDPWRAGPQHWLLKPLSLDHHGGSHFRASKARAWPSCIQPAFFDPQPWNISAMASPVAGPSHKQDQGLGFNLQRGEICFPIPGVFMLPRHWSHLLGHPRALRPINTFELSSQLPISHKLPNWSESSQKGRGCHSPPSQHASSGLLHLPLSRLLFPP